MANLLAGCDTRAMTRWRSISSGMRLKPMLSYMRFSRSWLPLISTEDMLPITRRVSSRSRPLLSSKSISNWPHFGWAHAMACRYSRLISSGLVDAPKLFTSSYLPDFLLTTTTLVLPDRFFFLRTYMSQSYPFPPLRHPAPPKNFRILLIINTRYLMAEKSDEVRKKHRSKKLFHLL